MFKSFSERGRHGRIIAHLYHDKWQRCNTFQVKYQQYLQVYKKSLHPTSGYFANGIYCEYKE
jgi:hypothetical protein